MTQLPPLPRSQQIIDAEHLKILSIFHFVLAGFAALGLLFILAHYTIFSAFLSDPKVWENQKQGPMPVDFFAIFKWFYLVVGIWMVGTGILNLLSGLFIRSRKHRTFSLFVSGINCLHFPFGTVLGVFTIIVLVRDSVRERYGVEK